MVNIIHVPKSAGTTLVGILQSSSLKVLHSDRVSLINNDYLQYDVIIGHNSFTTCPKYDKITILRNPVDRVTSHWFYLQNKVKPHIATFPSVMEWFNRDKITLEEFVVHTSNLMKVYIGEDIGIYRYIGFVEDYDKTISYICKILGIEIPIHYENKRVSDYSKELDPKEIDMIRHYNQDDIKLYEEARRVFAIVENSH